MDNLNTHSEHADQPQGQQLGEQRTNLSLFWFSLEQHRLQLDQVLQLHNEQVRVFLQQEMLIQNTTLLNLLESITTDELIQKDAEIASLRIELQRKQEDLETSLRDRDELLQLAVMAYEINVSLISRHPPVLQETNSHVSSNQLDAPGSGDEASSVARTAAETTEVHLICKVCNSGGACMLLLPCQHLCACKPCGVRLTACPICGAMKGDAIVPRFG